MADALLPAPASITYVIVNGSEDPWEGLFSALIFPEMQSPLTAISSQPEATHQSI